MVTVQTYECPVHGAFEVAVAHVYDLVRCWERFPDEQEALDWDCEEWCPWRPSAPAVHTPDTRHRALTGKVREENPW